MVYPRVTTLGNNEVLVDDTQVMGYREILSSNHRILFFTGIMGIKCQVCGQGELESHNLLMALDALSHDPITLVITSNGGDLDMAFLFYDTMKFIKSPIITVGRYCASAAALILAAGSKRYLFPHAKTMLHLATGQASGDVKDWDIQHKEMQKYQNKAIDILIECGVKKSRDEILVDIDRQLWLEPQEAIDYGLADEILEKKTWLKMIKGE